MYQWPAYNNRCISFLFPCFTLPSLLLLFPEIISQIDYMHARLGEVRERVKRSPEGYANGRPSIWKESSKGVKERPLQLGK